MLNYNTEYSEEILLAIDEMPIKEKYVKLELLNWQEEPIREIQGTLTGGNISINGDSTVRRTCNFSFVVIEDDTIENFIQLNSKFRLFIGLKNRLPQPLHDQVEDIIWFKEGTFVFCGASFSHSSSSTNVNVTAKDKMCLLNGDVAGTIPDTVIFNEIEVEDDEGNISYEQVLVFNIIQEMVNHYGGEKISNIYVSDIPEKIRQLMTYHGNRPIYMQPTEDGFYTGNFSFDKIKGWVELVAGDQVGYTLTDFIFPGELIAQPGDKVTTILDKIKSMLGNYEYFYDVDGKFHFQEIKNYLNNSYQPIFAVKDPTTLEVTDYQANFDIEETIYSFKENKKLISSLNNNPNYNNIKNDFVVWGVRKTVEGAEIPIRYHMAIDEKYPTKESDTKDWREYMYQYCLTGEDRDEEGWDYYNKELVAEWRNLYDGDNWLPEVKSDPRSLNFFIDFIDENSVYGEYSVNKIGRRTYAETNPDCVCVFNKEIPDVIFVETVEEHDKLIATNEYRAVAVAQDGLFDLIRISVGNYSCFERVRELLYQHLTLNESITINALPIYWLEPNRKIEVEDNASRIYGQYMIKSISLPLTYNGTMNIQATRALSRL